MNTEVKLGDGEFVVVLFISLLSRKDSTMNTNTSTKPMIYKATDYNNKQLIGSYANGSQKGNERFVRQTKEGRERYLRYANAHSKKGVEVLTEDKGFPRVPAEELRDQRLINKRALEQGFITQADYNYFYPKG